MFDYPKKVYTYIKCCTVLLKKINIAEGKGKDHKRVACVFAGGRAFDECRVETYLTGKGRRKFKLRSINLEKFHSM